jgi:hypothetical protein
MKLPVATSRGNKIGSVFRLFRLDWIGLINSIRSDTVDVLDVYKLYNNVIQYSLCAMAALQYPSIATATGYKGHSIRFNKIQ